MSAMRPLGVVGNVNVDLIMGPATPWPEPGTEVVLDHDDLRPGGAAGNVSLAWTGLGVPHQISANTGTDAFGDWLRASFPGLSDRWSRAAAATTVSVGLTHPDGERTFFTSRGHLPSLAWPEALSGLDGDRLAGGILLVCGSFVTERLASDYHLLFDWADARGIDVAIDTGWPVNGWTADVVASTFGWLERSRHVLLNEAETAALTGRRDPLEAMRTLDGRLPEGAVVVVKRGPAGAVARPSGGEAVEVRAPTVAVLDTIGAGDVFDAAYLRGIALGHSLREALAAGVEAASTAVATRPRRYARAA